MRVIKAVVTDLDGTIVDHAGQISTATVRALSQLADRKIPVIVATARTPSWLAAAEPLVRWVTVAACCGGAIGWSPHSGAILWRETIPPIRVDMVVQSSLAQLSNAGFGAYDGEQWRVTETFAATGPARVGIKRIVSPAEIAQKPVCVMCVCHPNLGPGRVKLSRLVTSIAPQLSVAYADGLADIAPAGVDKAAGVARALAEGAIDPAHAIAFGDAIADVPMFQLCGYSVAMANAHPEAIAAATAVAASVDNDGFARTLAELDVICDPCQ